MQIKTMWYYPFLFKRGKEHYQVLTEKQNCSSHTAGGIKNATVILEGSLAVSYKVNHVCTIWPSKLTSSR